MVKAKKQNPVVVTTQHKGVFFGYLVSQKGSTVTISEARNCLYWTPDVKGFVGLATTGPDKGCRIGPAAKKIELFDVTSVIEATPEAVANWEKSPWA